MGALLIPPVRNRQPDNLAEINWSNPITRLLNLAFDGKTARDVVRNKKFETAAGYIKPTRGGLGYEVTGSSTVAQLAGATYPDQVVSVFVLLDHTTPPSSYVGLLGRGTYASETSSDFSFENGGDLVVAYSFEGADGSTALALGSAPDSGLHAYAVSSTGTNVTAYIDGKNSGSDSFAWHFDTGAQTWLIGATTTDYLNESMPGKYLLALVWNRVLSESEHRSLAANPWQIFKGCQRLLAIQATGEVQLLSPVSDVSDGSWLPSTGSDLYATVDESSYSDTDYIYATSATTCTLAIAAGTDPAVSTGHTLRYRLLSGSGTVTVTLKQSTTTIASWGPHTLTGAAQDFAQTLTGGEADSITDYSALRVEFTAS